MSQAELWLRFGPFSLYPARKALTDRGKPVRLGGRALDLLIVLIENAGKVLSREELVAAVWPTTVVEETSLRVHVLALRKALGDGQSDARYIATIPGRGYSFVARVERVAVGVSVDNRSGSKSSSRHNLPARLNRLIGRSDAVRDLSNRLTNQRLVAIIGPGGIGKTSVALVVAEEAAGQCEESVIFVDLAPVSDSRLVATAVAATLPFTVISHSDDISENICIALAQRQMLIVLDNCEHVVEFVVPLVEKVMKAAPRVRILATSREPLRAEAEWVYSLAPLELPAAQEPPTLAGASHSPAVQLFVERAIATADGFRLTQENAAAVLHVCRQLDGIPLAIELAASRIDSLGINDLAERLDNRLQLLTRGRRLARPRHRDLKALIEWSYDLLTDSEKTVFRRLSLFRTGFSLEAAIEVVGCPDIDRTTVINSVLSLAAKSLITIDASGEVVQHRLLYSTRAYAWEKLRESKDFDSTSERHAAYFKSLLAKFSSSTNLPMDFSERVEQHSHIADDVRSAISWAISDTGNASLGVMLAVGAVQAALDAGASADQYGRLLEQAIEKLETRDDPRPQLELIGLSTLCLLSGYSSKLSWPRGDLLARTLNLSERCGSTDERIAALFGAVSAMFAGGHYLDARRLLERLRQLTVGARADVGLVLTDRVSLLVNHCLGDHLSSMALSKRISCASLENVPRQFVPPVPAKVAMGLIQARTLWLQGFADQAVALVDEAVEGTIIDGVEHPISICQVLILGVLPIAFWRGDMERASEALEKLRNLAGRVSLSYWASWLRSFETVVAQHRGHDILRDGQWALIGNAVELDHLATFSGSFLTKRTIARVESGEVGWCAPEILRVQAEHRLSLGDDHAMHEGELLLKRALDLAKSQQALAWELRIATSLGRLLWEQGMVNDAQSLLHDVLGRCTEGLGTADPVAAKALLDRIDASDEYFPVDPAVCTSSLVEPALTCGPVGSPRQ